MHPTHLKTFLAVVSEGSFSAAARAVHVSQSTVSSHVRHLEESLGTRLLDREPAVRPTRAGRLLVSYATRLLRLQREARREVREGANGTEPRELTIAAEATAIEALLPTALVRLRQRLPALQITVQSASAAAALTAVLAGACDVALVLGPVQIRDLATRPVGSVEFRVYGAPQRVSDRFVTCPPPLGPALPEGAEAGIHLASSWAARRCVLEGAGIGLLPTASVGDELRTGQLQVVDWPGTPTARALVAAHPATSTPHPAAEAMLQALIG